MASKIVSNLKTQRREESLIAFFCVFSSLADLKELVTNEHGYEHLVEKREKRG